MNKVEKVYKVKRATKFLEWNSDIEMVLGNPMIQYDSPQGDTSIMILISEVRKDLIKLRDIVEECYGGVCG